MAFSSAKKVENISGIVRQSIFSWDADGVTTGDIKTGYSNIYHISFNNDVTEGDGKAVASGGTVTISGVTSNDTGTISVWGY